MKPSITPLTQPPKNSPPLLFPKKLYNLYTLSSVASPPIEDCDGCLCNSPCHFTFSLNVFYCILPCSPVVKVLMFSGSIAVFVPTQVGNFPLNSVVAIRVIPHLGSTLYKVCVTTCKRSLLAHAPGKTHSCAHLYPMSYMLLLVGIIIMRSPHSTFRTINLQPY